MKASQEKPLVPFMPVTLTLETQEEVNAIFAVLNYSAIGRAMGMATLFLQLAPFKTDAYDAIHKRLCTVNK